MLVDSLKAMAHVISEAVQYKQMTLACFKVQTL